MGFPGHNQDINRPLIQGPGTESCFLPFLHLELHPCIPWLLGPPPHSNPAASSNGPLLLSSYNLLFLQDFVLTWATQTKQVHSGFPRTRIRTTGSHLWTC
ncbi:unnamed protein product [Rangifer tarandus platyrhynchus]|uniref:Uncharacterized protein n=1 Tax=Rangifer tarandus platyrhynchus TaxID=3082113 RepID=A0ABN8XSY5_RANTA|nr:unnamed protein product [Rangifer tarandus platyrhynchus]